MTGSDSFTATERQQAKARWLAYIKGSPSAVKPPIENAVDLELTDYKEKLENDMAELKRDKRYAFHFRLSVYRDTRYSVASSQYCLRLAMHNQLRAQGEVARLHYPLAIGPKADNPAQI